MATEVMLVKERGGLWPATDHDRVVIGRLDSRKPLLATIKQTRNPQRHRLYWAILNAVCDNHAHYNIAGPEALHTWLKLKMGLVDIEVYHDGSTRLVPQSTSFGAMDESTFRDYLDRSLTAICTEILPGTDRDDLLRVGREAAGAGPVSTP